MGRRIMRPRADTPALAFDLCHEAADRESAARRKRAGDDLRWTARSVGWWSWVALVLGGRRG